MIEKMLTIPQWIVDLNLNYQYVIFLVIFFILWGTDIWNDVIRVANGEKVDGWESFIGFLLSFIVAAFVSISWPHIWPLYIVGLLLIVFFIIVKKSAKVALLSGSRKK